METQNAITIDVIKEAITNELENWEIKNPTIDLDIETLADMIYDELWERIHYIGEFYEIDIEEVANGTFKEFAGEEEDDDND